MKVSIITINYNDKQGLEKTIISVINQTDKDFEYLVIDGNSNDGSKDIVEKYKEHFNYAVSEPDSGIYNAMNKGIDHATGKYLIFLNSGDYFFNNEVIEEFVYKNPTEDLVYGDVWLYHNPRHKILRKMPDELCIRTILHFTIAHQGIFHKKELFADGKRYNEKYKIKADWVFYVRAILENNATYNHIELIISVFDMNGLSSNSESHQVRKYEKIKFFHYLLLNRFKNLFFEFSKFRTNFAVFWKIFRYSLSYKYGRTFYKIRHFIK